jgi:NAD(P)-dependent dehydrogenase (short-subunit alcohol dehydrogenase family)
VGWTIDEMPDLHGRVAVVTGASRGLGYETSRALARRRAHVVMAVRDRGRGEAARDRILDEAPVASLEVVDLDLASLDSVRSAARAITAAHPSIDILVCNGGVMGIPFRRSAEGYELQLAVNHLAHFALTGLLLPSILRSRRARVILVTSTGRFLGRPLETATASAERGYDPWRAYGRSKLAMAQTAIELDRRFRAAGSRARAMAADPGFAHTDLQANARRQGPGVSQAFFDGAVRRFGSTPTQGALPQLRAATDPRAQGGALYALRFVLRGAPIRMPYLTRFLGDADRDAMWAASEALTGVTIDVAGTADRLERVGA